MLLTEHRDNGDGTFIAPDSCTFADGPILCSDASAGFGAPCLPPPPLVVEENEKENDAPPPCCPP